MAAKYWIKLYHEILEDSKMGRLPDNLWRRAIELFLMAGEMDDQGRLPCTADIAWRLRQSEEVLEVDLSRLEAAGILTKYADGSWLVTNFAKRQAPTETIDRVRQFRERKRKQQPPLGNSDEKETGMNSVGYAQVTKSYTDTDIDTESDKDKDTSPNGDGAGAPPPIKPKKPKGESHSRPPRGKPPKDHVPIPAAVKVYQDIARRLPDKALWLDIETKVGATPENLKRWNEVIMAYIGCGWNKLNLSGMLSFYEQGRIPTTEKVKGDVLGHPPEPLPESPDPPSPLPLSPEEATLQKALSDVKQQIPPWLATDIRTEERTNGTFWLIVSTEKAREWIDNRLKDKILRPALKRIDQSISEVEVKINDTRAI